MADEFVAWACAAMQEVRFALLTGFVKDVTGLVVVVLLLMLWLCVAGLDLIRQEDGSQLLLTNQLFLQFPVKIKRSYFFQTHMQYNNIICFIDLIY